jgi:hypothetical protein
MPGSSRLVVERASSIINPIAGNPIELLSIGLVQLMIASHRPGRCSIDPRQPPDTLAVPIQKKSDRRLAEGSGGCDLRLR